MFTEGKNRELREKLIKSIRRQVTLMDITDRLIDVYTTIIFAHFLSAAIIICFASIMILTVSTTIGFCALFRFQVARNNLNSNVEGPWSSQSSIRQLHCGCYGAIIHVCSQWNTYCWKCRFRLHARAKRWTLILNVSPTEQPNCDRFLFHGMASQQ